jgi:Flp pilus assembly pilin Flp
MHTLAANIPKLTSDTGQTMSEYAVVLGVIVLVTVTAYTQLGDAIEVVFTSMRALF